MYDKIHYKLKKKIVNISIATCKKKKKDPINIKSDKKKKAYSNWPTYPQLYVKVELVGGLDIVKELKENGELLPVLKGEN